MRKSRLALLLAAATVACNHPSHAVYVDLDQVSSASMTRYDRMKLPTPPKPLPAKTYTLPAIPAQTLENTASPEVLRTQADAEKAQAEALKTIRRRLTEIYLKQVDLYARQQMELLGDVNEKYLTSLLPKLHEVFLAYADKRMPLFSRLTFLAGFPDTNPKGLLPAPSARPVPKQRWLEANTLRRTLEAMDQQYDLEATAILGEAKTMADKDRLDVLKKIDDYRQEMLDRAMAEAMNPLKNKSNLKVLHIEAAPQIILPGQAARSVQIPATSALPPAPQVEFQRLGENATLSRELIKRQLDIWCSINDYRLVSKPKDKVRDATREFEQWRRQQEVGP